MNSELVRHIGESPVDNLFNSTVPPALTTGVTIRAGQGALKRGTILALSSDGDDMVILGTVPGSGEILTANCILSDPVDASGTEAMPGVAYRAGHFNRPALITKDGYALTRSDEESLRHGGIYLSDAIA